MLVLLCKAFPLTPVTNTSAGPGFLARERSLEQLMALLLVTETSVGSQVEGATVRQAEVVDQVQALSVLGTITGVEAVRAQLVPMRAIPSQT